MPKWLRHSADFPEFETITTADTVVDIGCGAGDSCVAAGQLGAEVIALDIDPTMIGYVTEKMRGVPARAFRAIQSDCNPIPLPAGVASVVLCTEVLEHVDDPATLLRELNRIGRADALYLISVPDPVSESFMRMVAHRSYFQRPNHRHVFEHSHLDSLLHDQGLKVVRRPETPNNGYWTIWCLLRWAVSEEGLPSPGECPQILSDWSRIWSTLESTPGGDRALARLDQLLPRSQVVVARKANGIPRPMGRIRAMRQPGRVKRAVKDGAIRVGGFHVSWMVRREKS